MIDKPRADSTPNRSDAPSVLGRRGVSNQWIVRGLLARVRTERPVPLDATDPNLLSTLPTQRRPLEAGEATHLAAVCPTGALHALADELGIDPARCVRCGRCTEGDDPAIIMQTTHDPVRWHAEPRPLPRSMRKSLHIRVVDAGGDCGACLNEVRQLNNPMYNMHRLGFFVTPTPRHADVLLVVGSVTEHMRGALEQVHRAMPSPRRVIAVGHCAVQGGLWRGTLTGGGPVSDVIDVDVDVLGAPPSPHVIREALLLVTDRRVEPDLTGREGSG